MLNEKEFLIISQRGFAKVIIKLRELGVEVIEVFPDKIEFVWCDHICSYRNGAFECGTQSEMLLNDISELDTDKLDWLVNLTMNN